MSTSRSDNNENDATTPSTPENNKSCNVSTPNSAAPATGIEFEPPLACVRRILKNALPSSTNVGKDASSAFCRACGIFCIYLTACANDIAREHKRQTITANDVLAAVQELDFDEFTPQLKTFLESYRTAEKNKRDAKAALKASNADEQPPSKKSKVSKEEDIKEEDSKGEDPKEEDPKEEDSKEEKPEKDQKEEISNED
eukprot:CAMPEP_0178920080 /NCGR_PEP_ID=MMETSP0786-20121207/14802_1 /TAXON_ID=186022 /ORGANISM="Thalassionema frauenfeldii, Strain CCMP 1798" /LENGTH=198 /DNA_ID=CAMNT_0020594099 /DNA_START=17 /DNA_END=613 /DNA_ORIENTATION=-